jgi:RHH-type proline utilization regulon transcriptional repressor/proline dehydrogenase/delta 1-pyrroline-5-carboxylate dehydrogenase
MRALVIGDPVLPGTDIGPVIDQESAVRIAGVIRRAADSGLALSQLDWPSGAGWSAGVEPWHKVLTTADGRRMHYIAPTIALGVPGEHELAREEVFGPVLAVLHAPTFGAALEMANDSVYKLTGGVFSRKPSHLEQARREFRVGNLYLNRGCTGALVARQPFGGFGMSGVGSKAGGADYLLQFVEPRAICENTMRRGFSPEL